MGSGNHVGTCRTVGNDWLVDQSGQMIWDIVGQASSWWGKCRQILTGIHQSQNSFLQEWLPLCPQYLSELLEREANGMDVPYIGCSLHPGILHYTDCFGNSVWCKSCDFSSHLSLPFHQIQIWNGKCVKSWIA